MKAIIMAGGEGTRLRPVSLNIPKPMVRLFDRPVLEHTLNLLKRNGITDACLTLRFLPQIVTDYFGDGSAHGMRLTHQIEDTPLGTAGSVAACGDFIGKEHVLILSGDAVCDFDLQACIRFHFEKQADATIVLYAHPDPLEYGLVMTDEAGRVERFIEKPPWNRVFTNRINTGIYILSPAAIAEIPTDGPYDFGKDLFPKLLEKSMNVYGVEAGGYWCDIGSPEAYLQSGMDALDEKLTLDLGADRRGQNIWSHAPIPPGVAVLGPCYIGKGAVLEQGAKLGPHAIIGAGSHIASGASVSRSMVDGALIGQDARLDGAIVGRNVSVRRGGILGEGSVIGDGTILGEDSVVDAKVRIWPGKELPPGSRVTENLITGRPRSNLRFSGGGVIRGEAGVVITPEAALAIGSALGAEGRVGVGCAGDAASRLAARAIACGVSAVGGFALELDCPFEAAASYAADLYGLARTVFVHDREGELCLKLYGAQGLPLLREQERRIEAALAAGELRRATGAKTGDITAAAGTLEAYITAAANCGAPKRISAPIAVEVRGNGGANRALRQALTHMGANPAAHGRGVPAFETARGGTLLRAEDEEGHILETEQLLAALVLLELEAGENTIAIPYAAPVALDELAAQFGANILRLGRDPGAAEHYYRLPHLRDAVFAVCRLAGAMAASGETLHTITQRIPTFRTARRELPTTGDRAALMQSLASVAEQGEVELVEGLRVPVASGWVHVSPSAGRPVLKVFAESTNMEAAEEICGEVVRLLEGLDKKTSQ
ncbi:MAG: sugar phosphate nucleotidyltransferase [Oscillospiraceae bacterium]|nr:sugar phosphate nucleotidyltransferase [Oscillospiraceae bacterium]